MSDTVGARDLIHLDVTRAVEPLEPTSMWHAARELAETFPFGV